MAEHDAAEFSDIDNPAAKFVANMKAAADAHSAWGDRMRIYGCVDEDDVADARVEFLKWCAADPAMANLTLGQVSSIAMCMVMFSKRR